MTAADLAKALGGHRTGGQFLAKCPCHLDRSPSLAIRDGQLGPLLFCHAGCSTRDVIDELRSCGLWNDRRDQKPRSAHLIRPTPKPRSDDTAGRSASAQSFWNAARDPRGTLAETYLKSRGLQLDEDLADRVLRFHPSCPWGKDQRVPALLAIFQPVRNAPGENAPPSAIIRIGLTAEGRKLGKGGDGKRMLGPVGGSAIKLDADEDVSLGLGITEGLETGFAVRTTGWRPVWVLGSAGAIATFPVLAGIEALTCFADHDSTGLNAAQRCAERWQAAGCEVFVRWPKGLGHDYADEVSR
jgi:hypothetical protein